ncbi:hypothetical protein IscW_ISCW003904 [Ixodes scapularis]|uniref:Uncharacterized protein n=1 Tax=Ixodes scapularis TaxID=6945 RepID=B7PGX8_IXOSC|nr:hypothetical protein IscW_ISCW003904 [Ixodes scapularis]|eukprot:XP_002401586.1 hypothetical protein IscW_ISCW003904 [Ixodes scapularis]
MCDDEVDGDDDFVTSRSGQLVPNSDVRQGTKRKNHQQESSSSKKHLNIPRRIVRLQYVPFFQMTDEDRETSNWLLTTLCEKRGVVSHVFNEYVKRILERNSNYIIVHNKNSDSFDLYHYSKLTGTMMIDSMSKLLDNLEIIAIKMCFEFEAAADPVTPFNLCYNYLIASARRFECKIDFSQIHTYLQSSADAYSIRLTTNRHLVMPSNNTYDLYDAKFVPWDSSQVCSVRSECNIDLGRDELVEHIHTEVYPTRGGLTYRCQLVRRAIGRITRLFSRKENHMPEFNHLVRTIGKNVLHKMATYASPELFMTDFLHELASTDENRFVEYTVEELPTDYQEYNDTAVVGNGKPVNCSSTHRLYGSTVTNLLAFRIMLKRHPSLYQRAVRLFVSGTGEDDDGGPVVFVRKEITWEQMVWTIFVELFGSSQQARMIMEFLALGLSTDNNGRIVLYLSTELPFAMPRTVNRSS